MLVNGKPAKASYTVKIGDIIEVTFGNRPVKIRVLSDVEQKGKDVAREMFEVIEGKGKPPAVASLGHLPCKGRLLMRGFARAKGAPEVGSWPSLRGLRGFGRPAPSLLSPPPAYITIVNKQGRNRHAGNKIVSRAHPARLTPPSPSQKPRLGAEGPPAIWL